MIDVRSSTLVSVEALLRWNHPELGLIGPGEFHSVLADQEIGPLLQQHVIKLAISELKRRPRFHGTLAVNFTSMDLRGREAAAKLLAKLKDAGVRPSSLCVEVTEGIILGKGGTEPAEALRALHEAGVQIALDDFGTGYASLVHLKEIPVDVLKIDRSFIAGLLEDGDESEEIVRAVLALGHGLNKTVVAEGVENVAQLVRLRELGCDHAQGFLFGRPSPAFPSTVVRAAAA
jgi:EAL domain-containing protein (putative c-di-GMP-specific phosphodiesterase class I)